MPCPPKEDPPPAEEGAVLLVCLRQSRYPPKEGEDERAVYITDTKQLITYNEKLLSSRKNASLSGRALVQHYFERVVEAVDIPDRFAVVGNFELDINPNRLAIPIVDGPDASVRSRSERHLPAL